MKTNSVQNREFVRQNTGLPECPPLPIAPSEWIPLASLEDMQKNEYDVLIVGTGAGGGAVLWRLIQQMGASGKRIAVLDRGGLAIPTHAQNIATMDGLRQLEYKRKLSTFIPGYDSPQVHALGGRMLFWGSVSPRMAASDLAKWPIRIEEMNYYYTLAEKALNVTGDFAKRAPLTQILLNRLKKNGFPNAIDTPLAINLEPVNQLGILNTNPFFSSIQFLAQALIAPYDLAVNARVTKVLIERNRAVGVHVVSGSKSYIFKSKNILLAASTFGTTQILLNSELNSPAIGHYFTNHSMVNGLGQVSRLQFPEELGPLRILIPAIEKQPYQIQIGGPISMSKEQYMPLTRELFYVAAGFGEVESRYENAAYLDPSEPDEDQVPSLKLNFSYSERDLSVIEQMSSGIRHAVSVIQPQNPLLNICLSRPGNDIHETGTCRLGIHPSTSGTNLHGQVHGIQGLYVADGSVIPYSGTANITLTIVALAIRTADAIIQRLK